MSGNGPATTPSFAVQEGKFTVRVACTNEGTIKVSPEGDREPIAVTCDGNTRRIHVVTDEKRENVLVAASESQRWTVSVVISADFATVAPKASSFGI